MPSLPSKEYWIKRAEQTLIAGEKSALAYEKDLQKAYKQTTALVKKEIEAFYGRYATDAGISLAEARKRLNNNELKDFQASAKKYLEEVEKAGPNVGIEPYRSYLKELSGKAYVSRIQELTTNIRHHIELNCVQYEKGLKDVLENGYEDGYYRTLFDVQKQAGFGVSFTAPGAKLLDKAVREKWLGRNYSDSIWEDKKRLVNTMEQLLSQEFVRGRGSRQAAKTLADKLGVSYNNACRLLRTEINYISNKGTMQAYKDSGVVQSYEYLATLDSRTSDICRELDGKVFALAEAKVGVNLPPLHPYCRSTTVPYFPDDEIGKVAEDRVARDENGHTYKVGKNVTFKEWVDNYAEAAYAKRVKRNPRVYKEVDITPEKAPLPKTLQGLQEHEKKWYQDKVLSSLSEKEAEALAKSLKGLIDDSDLAMRVPDFDILDKIIDGGFKSQFETNSSRGSLNTDIRKDATAQLFGIDRKEVDSFDPSDFEKYGYLASHDVDKDFSSKNHAAQYGKITVRFKKDRVAQRTTMTVDDSLGPAMRHRVIATPVTNPTAGGIISSDLRNVVKRLPEYIDQNPTEPHLAIEGAYGRYFELQYHGKLTMEDVESITYKGNGQRVDNTSTMGKVIDKLEKLGIKVYEAE